MGKIRILNPEERVDRKCGICSSRHVKYSVCIFDDEEIFLCNRCTLHSFGIEVNREYMLKALIDARGVYENGYEAGKRDAVRHGRWIKTPNDDTFYCSECGYKIKDNRIYNWETRPSERYCGGCGVKMDLEEDENA